ncbi:hypothetical protein [Aeromonas hydrophila]|uniref:hypothetical protein n=1 Tax=Aeromonas hydrophila TaxID=644 RepID=UPI00214C84F8|nr:hypothetical protein [Aeromonas hydrophila]
MVSSTALAMFSMVRNESGCLFLVIRIVAILALLLARWLAAKRWGSCPKALSLPMIFW